MIRGILFDKDGTLLDFNGTWLGPYLEATRFIADCFGRPELAMRMMVEGGYLEETGQWEPDSPLASGSNAQVMALWSRVIGSPIPVAQEARLRQIFAGARYVPAVRDIKPLLCDLVGAGLTLGLATMDDEENARGMLSKLELEAFFEFTCGADSGFGVKPEPGMIQAFCRHCSLDYDEVIMVGDSPKDLNMGRNAGIRCSVGVLTGAHGRGELEPWADFVLPDISALPALVSQLNGGHDSGSLETQAGGA